MSWFDGYFAGRSPKVGLFVLHSFRVLISRAAKYNGSISQLLSLSLEALRLDVNISVFICSVNVIRLAISFGKSRVKIYALGSFCYADQW